MADTSVRRRRFRQLIAVLLAAHGSIVGVSTACATGLEGDLPQEVVTISDLNLRDPRGVAAAYGRLLWAAQRVCTGADSADYWVRASAIPCLLQAVSRAVDHIGAPELTAYALAQPLFRHR